MWELMVEGLSARVGQFQAVQHEQHQLLPALEAHVLGQYPQVLEESVAARQCGADEGTAAIQQFQHRVEEECQQVQRQQRLSKEQLSVTEVVFEVITLGLQRVDILVLDLPACS